MPLTKALLILSFLSSLFGATAQDNTAIKMLSSTQFKQAISKDSVQLLDVRTVPEFLNGHIKGAVNIDFLKPKLFIEGVHQLDKEMPVYLYCRSGNRSNKAAKQLISLGFKEIYDLKGGYLGWN
ncbi:rhodanese-like domain-containing protein [uncultured Nonlabens sp.]|uniref:rhodanese-like domain-containing protein n=1 Tax=uncultured Nonlabens sp. TaxID=859306 RepID=UPI0030D7CFAC|tara:strand:+ start:2060 stop:2431 length:372 start_codon:yes stop_codon:yes gene_type:complete